MTHFKGRDIVSIDHFTHDELMHLIKTAIAYKQNPKSKPDLRGRSMAYAFFEDSTRTRLSFVRSAQNLGMNVYGFDSPAGTSLQKGESTHHTLQMLCGYNADALVMRHGWDGAAQLAADLFDIPVINGGDGRHEHPTQTMLDGMTIFEKHGRLEGLTIALVGDNKNGRTVHSFMKAYPNNTYILVNPPGLDMPQEYIKRVKKVMNGMSLEEAIRFGANVCYVTRIQAERIEDETERKRVLGSLQLKASMLEHADPDLIIMHPLPINADFPEIEKSLYDGTSRHARFFTQAANGVPMREVLLAAVLGNVDFKGQGYKAPQRSDQPKLNKVPIGADGKDSGEGYIMRIEDGIVIDHIPQGLAGPLLHDLKLDRTREPYFLGDNLQSSKSGHKGLFKLVGGKLTNDQLNTIAIYCPGATISEIAGGNVVDKYQVELADRVVGSFACSNSKCITNNPREIAPKVVYTISRSPGVISCHYCDTHHSVERGNVKPIIK